MLTDINEDGARNTALELSEQDHQVLALGCDVSDERQVAAAVRQTVDTFGRLDMAFNNAGIIGAGLDLHRDAPDLDGFDPHVGQVSWFRVAWAVVRRQAGFMIGRLEKTVVDCPDPRRLAAFYAAVLGMRVNEDSDDWVVIGLEPGMRQVAFQRAVDWQPPRWPDPRWPQQLHLDIRVDDVDQAQRAVLELGARRLPAARESGFRVFADPVGHPFCLVFGRSGQS